MTIQKKIKKLIDSRRGVAKKVSKPKTKSVEKREDLLKKMGFPEPPKHQHGWKIVGKTYAPPSNISVGGDVPAEVLERITFGVTTLLWECPCGETKLVELLGNDDDLLESLIDKADKIGPQFVERRGKSFIVSEWKPQIQNPNMIPLK